MLFESVGQGAVFLACTYGGLAIGLLYEALRIVRAVLGNGGVITALFDFAFCVGAGAVVICVSAAANQGDVKLFMLLGFAAGFLLFRAAFSPILSFFGRKIKGAHKKIIMRLKSTAFGKNMLK